ncbi:MFS transporter [Streptomyces antimycoticus]|uniref:MFS transporter n=1 Tax=Streptomyces antimycoticus TaxID=68175 RepID=UPI00369361E9
MTVTDTSRGTGTAATSTTHHRHAFALLGSVRITLIFTLAALAVPLPEIGRAFGLERADLILLSTAYGLTFAGLLLFGARLSDRYGGRRALTAGLIVFAAALNLRVQRPRPSRPSRTSSLPQGAMQ